MYYATLEQVKSYVRVSNTNDDVILNTLIKTAQNAIDLWFNRRFDARVETRLYDYPIPHRGRLGVYDTETWVARMSAVANLRSNRLKLDDDLLEASEVLNGNDVEITSSDYVLEPANLTPKNAVRIKSGRRSVYWQPASDGTREQVISVTGIWGWHQRWDTAFVSTGDSVQNDPQISASGTSLEVSDIDGDAADGETDRIQVGNMLKIDDEYLDVTAINTSTNVATVVRGYNGTTAAAHTKDTTVYVYRPFWSVVLAMLYLVKLHYRAKDSDEMNSLTILETGIQITPETFPKYIRDVMPQRNVRGRGRHL